MKRMSRESSQGVAVPFSVWMVLNTVTIVFCIKIPVAGILPLEIF